MPTLGVESTRRRITRSLGHRPYSPSPDTAHFNNFSMSMQSYDRVWRRKTQYHDRGKCEMFDGVPMYHSFTLTLSVISRTNDIYGVFALQGNKAGKEASQPVTVEKIKDIGLQRMTVETSTGSATSTTGELFPASDLWKDQPAIVFVVRRPGCPLCREHGETFRLTPTHVCEIYDLISKQASWVRARLLPPLVG